MIFLEIPHKNSQVFSLMLLSLNASVYHRYNIQVCVIAMDMSVLKWFCDALLFINKLLVSIDQ